MSFGLLKGKRGIITGALDEASIAWQAALKCVEQGASITLTNTPLALRMKKVQELAEICKTECIPADSTDLTDLENLFTKSTEVMGGKIDFVLHSIGMSPNIRKSKAYNDINYEWYKKTLDISALSFHKILQVADQLDALNSGASVVGLSYIAAQRAFPKYGDMAEAKAMLESIARSFGEHLGRKKQIRVNTISQSPTHTTAGKGIKGFDSFFQYADMLSPLGNANAEECADYIVVLFSDLTRKVTMQNLFHDGGFSTTGISHEMMENLNKS